MSEKRAPDIRFRGFTNPWEQRKLGDIATFINGRAYSQPELLSEGKYKVLRVGNFYTNDSWYYSDLELSEKYYANNGDLLYTWSATFGPHIWLGDKVIYHYHIWKVELSERLEKLFAVQLLEQDKANILSSKNGSTMVHITKEGMEEKDVIIPADTSEQKLIGDFFGRLDSLIALHQRKLKKLQTFKQAMLEKMFPKEGSLVPEIRFRGFQGDWKRRKLAEFLFESKEENNDDSYGKEDVLSVSGDHGIVNQIKFQGRSYAGASLKNYKIVKTGDVVYTRSPLKANPFGIIKANNGQTGIVSVLYVVYKPRNNACSNFIQAYFEENSRLNNYLYPLVSKGAKNTLQVTADYALEGRVVFPSLEEQKAVAFLFTKLDIVINCQQRKLSKLQTLKQSLLQKMFV